MPVASLGLNNWEIDFIVKDGDYNFGDTLTVGNIQLLPESRLPPPNQGSAPIPEPPVLLLMAMGLLGLRFSKFKKNKQHS